MKYDEDYRPVFNSELAVNVLKVMGSREDGDYGSRIAKTLGKSQASISRILGELHSIGFIRKSRREKAQYYEIDYDGIGSFWYDLVYEKLERSEEQIGRKRWFLGEYNDKEEMLKGFKKNKEDIIDTVSGYSREVFEGRSSVEGLKVSEILFEQFGLSIGHNIMNEPGFLEGNTYLECSKDALIYLWDMEGFSHELNRVVEGESKESTGLTIKKVKK